MGPAWEEEKQYFRSVEERFCALRGASMLISPKDWALIDSWWKEEVPLSLILEALEEVFASKVRRGELPESIGSLAYARNEVQRRFRLHRDLVALRRGAGETDRLRQEIRLHLGRLSRHLTRVVGAIRDQGQESLAQALAVGAAEIRQLRRSAGKPDWNPGCTEESLRKIELEVLDLARQALGESERKDLEDRVGELLSRHGRTMKEDARRSAVVAFEEDLLRRRWQIPRISLLPQD